ncbi:TnsA endonuclease N-terminal domain-containing protein [Enterovibrio paralichthyis]|uniref:TnsA endonuclease N-terminal domain-containing protein n=1 Tax=Enterovibrio paralichthyis TaxID=2853805 RepID=UPI001C46D3B1|nr:TnsA endonuclease N-terminal domain-containing protein [Enterovibrio paralichthyis]MBV7297275.1 Tn7 transposase TnsA N-terminal domain-containing protein [Enterovibrio paralichthyis]
MYPHTIKKPHAKKNVFKFISVKNSAIITCESSLEFDACFHLEYHPNVVSFESQPFCFNYQLEDRPHSYTPDFLVTLNSGHKSLQEIKDSKFCLTPEYIHIFEAMQKGSEAIGFPLHLVTERQIRKGFILDNLKLIHRYAGSKHICDFKKSVIEVIQNQGLSTPGKLVCVFGKSIGFMNRELLELMSLGLVKAHLENSLFNEDTELWVKE